MKKFLMLLIGLLNFDICRASDQPRPWLNSATYSDIDETVQDPLPTTVSLPCKTFNPITISQDTIFEPKYKTKTYTTGLTAQSTYDDVLNFYNAGRKDNHLCCFALSRLDINADATLTLKSPCCLAGDTASNFAGKIKTDYEAEDMSVIIMINSERFLNNDSLKEFNGCIINDLRIYPTSQ